MKNYLLELIFSKEKLDATIILACGMNEIGSREYGCFQIHLGHRKLCNWVKTNAWNTIAEEWLFCGEDTGSCSIGLSKWALRKRLDMD